MSTLDSGFTIRTIPIYNALSAFRAKYFATHWALPQSPPKTYSATASRTLHSHKLPPLAMTAVSDTIISGHYTKLQWGLQTAQIQLSSYTDLVILYTKSWRGTFRRLLSDQSKLIRYE